MNEAEFWQVIEATRGEWDDPDALERLVETLAALPPREIADFERQFERAVKAADKELLWAAALLLNGGSCGDDSFEYFRCWLISRGQEVYRRALADPDSLADEPVEFDQAGPLAQWEGYCYAGLRAYEATGAGSLGEAMGVTVGEGRVLTDESFDWEAYTDEVLAQRLPRLWGKYGHYKQQRDAKARAAPRDNESGRGMRIVSEAMVPGLGLVKIGSSLRHRRYGVGKVIDLSIIDNTFVMARIDYGDGPETFQINDGDGIFTLLPDK